MRQPRCPASNCEISQATLRTVRMNNCRGPSIMGALLGTPVEKTMKLLMTRFVIALVLAAPIAAASAW